MYCRNCGKEMLDDAKFCSCCGKSVDVDENNRKISLSIDKILKTDIKVLLHYSSIICAAVIVLLSFSQWIQLDFWFISSNVSVVELIGILDDLNVYDELVIMLAIAAVIIILMITIVVRCLQYVVKAFRAGNCPTKNDHIICGYSAMLAVVIACISFIIIIKLILLLSKNNVVDVSVNIEFYLIFALACLNRFILLPRYNKIIYMENAKWKERQTETGELWICKSCNTKNERHAISCKNCGEYK